MSGTDDPKPAPRLQTTPPGRREQARYEVTLEVTLSSEHNFFAAMASNLSGGGIFVATEHTKPVGHRVEFTITLPGQGEPVRGVGEIRWVREHTGPAGEPAGMGIAFVDVDPDSLGAIVEFLGTREPTFLEG